MDKLIIGPGIDADQYYATGLALHSPFITLVRGKKRYLAAGGFEYPQAAAVWPTVRFEELGKTREEVIRAFLKKYKVSKPLMPATTIANVFRLVPGATLSTELFPERRVKRKDEIKAIREMQQATDSAITAVRSVLERAKIVNGKLQISGKWLTSEMLKRIAAVQLAAYNASCPDMIISSGKQSALPHHTGSGVIQAGSIVVDIFPQSHETKYYADCTRTFCVGKTPKLFEERYAAVLAIQKEMLRRAKSGATDLNKQSQLLFEEFGIKTNIAKGQGYIHTLGHGVGLDIHEEPRISQKLVSGNVITIEPGLYYDYGIRIEDMGVVGKTALKPFSKLSRDPYL